MNINVKVKDKIFKPLEDVFNAVVNPEKLSSYFVSKSSGAIEKNANLIWFFNGEDIKVNVHVLSVIQNKFISYEWEASGIKALVEIEFSQMDNNATVVTITEKSFPFDTAGVAKALQQTQGWTDFICTLKAFLYCGINLRNGTSKGTI
jgi:uncharacterized protein YndB with AHSA1/START domain